MTIGTLLKAIDIAIYKEYVAENYVETHRRDPVKPVFEYKPKPIVYRKEPINLPTIASLPNTHAAKAYILSRKLPLSRLDELYFASDFKMFVDEIDPEHGKNLIENEARIIIPFYDEDKNLTAIQGRALEPNAKIRYITIKVDADQPKIFGLDKLDKTESTYVLEGPFDSMFIPNSLAVAGSSLVDVLSHIDRDKTTFIFDNEPRNKDIIRQMNDVVDLGLNIFLWPETVHEKDINNWILAGWSSSEILNIIDTCSFRGLEAKYRISTWKKT